MGFRSRVSRSRLVLAIVCLVAAALAVGLVYVPAEWLAQAGDAIQAAAAYLLAFGTRSWLFAAGGALVVCAALLVLLPRRRPHAYWAGRRSHVLPDVAVFLDLENQLSALELRPFIKLLRMRLAGRRADLYLFTDAANTAKGKMYQELWRFGFRPIDVPHRHLGVANVKNIVDVELSLYAYERALIGPARQEIILIAADQDYLPLVYRLHALGHRVAVWGRVVPDSYKSLRAYLGIEILEFGPLVGRKAPAAGVKPDGKPTRSAAPSWGAPGAQTVPSQPVQLVDAIRATASISDAIPVGDGAPEKQMSDFKARLGALASTTLRPIGYEGNTRTACWLEVLVALGVLQYSSTNTALVRGPVTAEEAARSFEQFLRELADVAISIGRQATDHVVRYTEMGKHMGSASPSGQRDDGSALRALIAPHHTRNTAHTRYFCRCAHALGLLDFEEVMPGATMRVRLPSRAEPSPADAAAESGEAST